MANPTKQRVLDKISEFDSLGRQGFLKKYANNRPSKEWVILRDGKIYDAKAIWAAAHNPPISPSQFHYNDAKSGMQRLGFEVVSKFSDFDAAVQKALKLDNKTRLERLAKAPKKPKKIQKTFDIFIRSALVVAQALVVAAGKCGKCSNPAPFVRKTNSMPYLEVHHKIRLADGGDDTVENAIALCHNCHREAHYG